MSLCKAFYDDRLCGVRLAVDYGALQIFSENGRNVISSSGPTWVTQKDNGLGEKEITPKGYRWMTGGIEGRSQSRLYLSQ